MLLTAGNLAGEAIAVARTNAVHAISYPITVEYHIGHGTAVGMLLPYVVGYMDFRELPELFDIDSTEQLVRFLKKQFIPPRIPDSDANVIAMMAGRYGKINEGTQGNKHRFKAMG